MSSVSQSGAAIRLRGLGKSYKSLQVLRDVNLDIAPGEFVTLLGPSGSGKTTTLNLIAGFLAPDHGQIFLDDKDLTAIPAYKRGIGVVFQNYALFPHMTVAENIAYPLQQRKPRMSRDTISSRVAQVLKLVHMGDYAERRTDQLSGGQQQRVALARAVVFEPKLLLLDEPLGALDKRLRESLQMELRRIHRELGVTIIFVTHDQDEALTLSDRIVVFRQGSIEQIGTPEELYDHPRTEFAATFLGDSNIFEGTLAQGRFNCADGHFAPIADQADRPIKLMVRPEKVSVVPGPFDMSALNLTTCAVPVTIEDVVFAGASVRVEAVTASGLKVMARCTGLEHALSVGDKAHFVWAADSSRLIDRTTP
ncbi:MAG: ABC transporter ATP-binding protein [Comamonadaceae bacterium]|nr:ABC transporter ATP-binding protein [Comamonadaceae bacterium]